MSGSALVVLALGPVAVVLIAIGLATVAMLAALMLGLGRQLRDLAGSLAALRKGTEPLVAEIRTEGERAQKGAIRLQEKQRRLREERDRIRRARAMSRQVRRRRGRG